MLKNLGHLALNLLSTILLFTPYAPLGALLAGINAAWYFYDGDILGGLYSLGIVLGGVGGLIGGTAGQIMSGCGNLLLAGTSTWSAGQSIGKMYMDYQETGKINPWDAVSATMNLGMAVMGGYGAFKSFSSLPAIARIKEAEISAKAASGMAAERNGSFEGAVNTSVDEPLEEALTASKSSSKTGPKPFGTGAHNEKIAEVASQVKDGKIIAGGQVLPEKAIPTSGGFKNSRRPDILVEKPDGSIYGINVGKTTSTGAPITREVQAIYDLEDAGIQMYFVPYFS